MKREELQKLIVFVSGVLLLFIYIFNRVNPININSLEQLSTQKIVFFLIYLIIRIISAIICVNLSKSKNRNNLFWGIFGFVIPPISLIIIGLIKTNSQNVNSQIENNVEKLNNNNSPYWLLLSLTLFIGIYVTTKGFSVFKNISAAIQIEEPSITNEYDNNEIYFKYNSDWKIEEDFELENYSGNYISMGNSKLDENTILSIYKFNKVVSPKSTIAYIENILQSSDNFSGNFTEPSFMNFKGQEAYKVDFNGIVENEEIIGKIISYNIDHKNICLLHFASNKNFIKTENEFNDLLNSLKIKLKPRLSDSETNPDSFSLYKKSTEFSLLYPKSWSEVRLNPGELFLRATTNKNIGGVIMLQKVVAVDDNIILSEKSYLENFSKRLNGAILESDFYNYKDYFVAYTKSRTFDGENHNISLHFAYFKKDIQYVYYITVYEDYYKLNKSEIDKIAFSLRLYQ